MIRKKANVTASHHLPTPLATTIALIGLVAFIGIVLVRFGHTLVTAGEESAWHPVSVALVVVSAVIAISVPVFAAWLLKRGWRWAPLLVSFVAVWGCSQLFTYSDGLAVASVLIMVVTVVAVWMPSAREYASSARKSKRPEIKGAAKGS